MDSAWRYPAFVLQAEVELLHEAQGEKVVIVAHSMGVNVWFYFMDWDTWIETWFILMDMIPFQSVFYSQYFVEYPLDLELISDW